MADEERLNLRKVREEINRIDRKIVEDLAKRFRLVEDVFAKKEKEKLSFRDRKRETELLGEVVRLGREQGLDAYFITRVFQEIIGYSLKVQKTHLVESGNGGARPELIRVAFQGIEEAYSHLAGRKYFSRCLDTVDFRPCATFSDVIEAVESGDVDYGVLPVENTTAGSINEVYDLLLRTKLSIVGEEVYEVIHCLSAIADIPLANIRRIYSHPQALAQCSNFLSLLQNCHVESFTDTAESVKKIKDDQDLSEAAIASEQAALAHGLVILKRGIANQKENYTRFFVLAKKPVTVDRRIPAKTSLVLSTAHHEGALARCLDKLAQCHLSMTKLESRPRPGNPFEYLFYVDFEGNLQHDNTQKALEELRRESTFLRVLGTYPALDREKSTPSVVDLVAHKKEQGEDHEAGRAPAAILHVETGNRLVSRTYKTESTLFNVKGVMIGGSALVVAAGPAAVEDEDHIRICARNIKESGAHILYGGCFSAGTPQQGFQGLGFEGLNYLARAGQDFELPVMTEVLLPEDVLQAAQQADILQIGPMNMQNFALLEEAGRVDRPVVLVRNPTASLEELLGAAEFILSQGNQQVILCEGGIRTLETSSRNTLDLSAVPLLKGLSHLPIMVSPAASAASREYVGRLSLAAKAAGTDMVLLYVHPEPEEAVVNGPHSLGFSGFSHVVGQLFGDMLP